jgi:DNA-binding response OmpR family regulator
MNFPIELYVEGSKRTVVLEDLSRTGMFVRVTQPIPVGTIVHVAMAPIPGRPRVLTQGTVMHTLDDAEATRLGRAPGIGVQFREPVNARDQQFLEVIGEMVGRHIRVESKPALRIVVADHHPHVVEQLSDRLARAGFAVAVATTGVEVLSACHRHEPDVILLDRHLPLLDGFQLLGELAANQVTAPVILTSYDHADFARAFELGASDFLQKPFTVRELIARARRLARLQQRVVLRGSLAEVQIPVLLTMLEQARKTGRLVVTRERERVTVDLFEGRIVDARAPGGRSVHDVLMTMLDWTEGSFELATAAEAERGSDLAISVTHLLLEHARIADEMRLARQGASGDRRAG